MALHVNTINIDWNNKFVATFGKQIKAFTVEKSEYIAAHKAITLDSLRFSYIGILKYFTPWKKKVIQNYTNYALALAKSELLIQAQNANYLIKYEQKIFFDGITIFVYITANALHMYEGALPLYNITHIDPESITPHSTKNDFSISAIYTSIFTIASFILLFYGQIFYSKHLVEKTSYAEEAIIWSYISKSVESQRSTRMDLKTIENSLNSTLSYIKSKFTDLKYDYSIMILNDEDVDLIIYPNGKIAFTKGLVEEIETQNQAIYLILHSLYQAENKEHLKALGSKIISLHLIAKVFGQDSIFGSAMIWKSDFHNAFTVEQELLADKLAITKMNEIYGGIGGLDIFKRNFYSVSNSYLKLFDSHPFSAQRDEKLNEFLDQNNFDFLQDHPFRYKAIDIQPQNKISNFVTNYNEQFFDLFNLYKKDIEQKYSEYEQFLLQFKDILIFNENLTINDLHARQIELDKAAQKVNDYKKEFQTLLSNHNKAFIQLSLNIHEKEQRVMLISLWEKELQSIEKLSNFYLKRDKEILEEQSAIMGFLMSRYSSLKIDRIGVKFKTRKEASDYNDFLKRLDKLIRSAPDTNR